MTHTNFHKTLIFAHRGANRETAENTRASFEKALKYPIDGIETDIQMSRDEVAVLWHDRYTDKLGHPGKRIDDFDFAELEAMNFAACFEPAVEYETVVTLKEFISTYRGRCRLQLEIKNRDWEPVSRHVLKVKQTLDLLESADELDVFISSFNLPSLAFANHHNNKVPLFYSLNEGQGLIDAERALTDHSFLTGLCLPIQILDQTMMQYLRELDKKVLTYTCNTDEHIQKALESGVDVLITDEPARALQMRMSCSESFQD